MEVTPEMIEAVRAHEVSEKEREDSRLREKYDRRLRDKEKRLKAGALAQVRTILPDLTDCDFSILADIFHEYLHEVEDW